MIKVEKLCKRYGSNVALKDLSISIKQGEIVGLLGLNGAGKSTTMNILAGCLAATSGSVHIDEIDICDDPIAAKKKIGYLPEIPPLYMDMKTKDYLNFVYDLKKVKGDKKKEINRVCEKLGILDKKERLIKNLSKGYRQRVGFAQALIGNPPILILDEPTVGLDPAQIIEIRGLIKEMGENHTVIISSHILSEIQAICKRVIVLNHGQMIADDTPEKLEMAARHKNVCRATIEGKVDKVKATLLSKTEIESVNVLGQIDENIFEYEILGTEVSYILRPIFFALVEAGFVLLDVHSTILSLEDIFVQLVSSKEKGELDNASYI